MVKNFLDPNEGLEFNAEFIYGNYFPHYSLIKIIEEIKNGTIGLVDFFNIIEENCFILCICTDQGCLVYANDWTENAIDDLVLRIDFTRFRNWPFLGTRNLIVDMLTRHKIDYAIEKDRLVYVCEKVNEISVSSGYASQSEVADLKRITDLTHEYGLEEWGERDGKGYDYTEGIVLSCIAEDKQVQWNDNGIFAIAQVMNLENNMPVIGSLYTDTGKRKNGYASSLLYEVTSQLLDQGYSSVSLLSDVTNPTSNKIFDKVGYFPIYKYIIVKTISTTDNH